MVFEIHQDGTERVVYSFSNKDDGAGPVASLTTLHGLLYGTAISGGEPSGHGVVFELHADGTERTVHVFAGTPDGDSPTAELTLMDGAFYGTTTIGGSSSLGCVFEVKATGEEHVVYSFKGASSGDGSNPTAGLTVLNGLLYGVTSRGGANDAGIIFDVDKNGTEHVIHTFNGTDGNHPRTTLVVLNGLLYGTTTAGGAN
jgi:uncharacterized repeat protein (TIGR03803 family)